MQPLKRALSIEIIEEKVESKRQKNEIPCILLDDNSKDNDFSVEHLNQIHLDEIKLLLNDCDSDFIREMLANCPNNLDNRVQFVVNKILDLKNYPRKKKKSENKKQAGSDLNKKYDIGEFLLTYPDPIAYFNDKKKNPSKIYKQNCLDFLCNKFLNIHSISIENLLKKFDYLLYSTYNELSSALYRKENELKQRCIMKNTVKFQFHRNNFVYHRTPRPVLPYKENFDERFLLEKWFIENEKYIIDVYNKRKEKILKAKNDNSLFECSICFENQLLLEDMIWCEKCHQFCLSCFKRYIETNIGLMKYEFTCCHSDCDAKFSKEVLESVLDKNVFEKLEKKITLSEIDKASLPNLESCPFCDYKVIIDNPYEKLFNCLDPDCMKVSCRKCKEPDHLPKDCEEAKKDVDVRTWIENKINEAMIRTCHQCNKRFYKEEGCNMIHCKCGAKMCYVCREPITDYAHFYIGKKCNQNNDTKKLHLEEMKNAYENACKEYKELFPNKIDPKLVLDLKTFLEDSELNRMDVRSNQTDQAYRMNNFFVFQRNEQFF